MGRAVVQHQTPKIVQSRREKAAGWHCCRKHWQNDSVHFNPFYIFGELRFAMLNQTETLQGPRRQETPCCYDGRRSGKANWREWKACGFESLSGSSSKLDSVHDRFLIWYKSFSMVEKRIIYQSQRGFLQETGSCSPNWPLNALNIATAFEPWVRCLCEGFAQWLQGWSTTGSTKRSKGSDGAGWHVRCRAAVKTSQLTLCIFVHWTLT